MIVDPYRFGKEFDPLADLDGGLAFWGKQDYTVTSDPDIDAWIDESAVGVDAIQGTASDKPHKTDAIINGFDVARFDGSNDYLNANQHFQTQCRNQLGYGMVLRAIDGRPSSTEVYCGNKNASSEDRGLYFFVGTDGKINIFYESNDILGRWKANIALPNGAVTFGFIVWIDKTGGFIKVGKAFGGSFTELADDGVDDGDLSAVTPADYNSTSNPFWGALSSNGSDTNNAQIDITEGFVQGGMTQADFDAWGARFLSVYDL